MCIIRLVHFSLHDVRLRLAIQLFTNPDSPNNGDFIASDLINTYFCGWPNPSTPTALNSPTNPDFSPSSSPSSYHQDIQHVITALLTTLTPRIPHVSPDFSHCPFHDCCVS